MARSTPEEVAARTLAIVAACRRINDGSSVRVELSDEHIAAAIVADAIDGATAMLDENGHEAAAILDRIDTRLDKVADMLDRIDDRLLAIKERG